jgi:hypothetical protein
VSQQWIAVVVALLTGGAVTTVVNYFLSRETRELEKTVKQHDAAVAGLAILVDQIQEERDYFRDETQKLRQMVALLELRVKGLENGG